MRSKSTFLMFSLLTPSALCFSFPQTSDITASISNIFNRSGGTKCPAIWTTISLDLTKSFLANGQCTDLARAAIRYAFHDAGTFSLKLPFTAPAAGGADGSLLLNPTEISRPENNGLQDYNKFIGDKFTLYKPQGVGAADLIYFAGNHAVVTCPGGPSVKTVIGRTDSSTASPTGVMPPGFGPGSDHDSLLKLFVDKGFSAEDLAALVGAHSTSKNIAETAIPVGASQDSTPGVWDVKFYAETYNPPQGVVRFDSDIALSNKSTAVGKKFAGFVDGQGKWTGKFADAMYRLSVLGVPSGTAKNFVECTDALPKAVSVKRDIRGAAINARAV
ncbi:heme peroxidase [Pseudovirgaria hyperparasitica]|uniref:Peroxidase n=1 Tax=Pseudovirgaria hyperparasitica TaxID=470096 RepID=A0A6A6WG48_9PEZI|nr:heme peroxidase [Pseudovirgaria hyperparasitica]KAF2760916.1 heme peroxidase [Pseudovirgaria hyperparasitica]